MIEILLNVIVVVPGSRVVGCSDVLMSRYGVKVNFVVIVPVVPIEPGSRVVEGIMFIR